VKLRTLILSTTLVALVATGSLAIVSAASAERIWVVLGDQLLAGESKPLKSSGSNFLLKGKASGLSVELKCTKQGGKELSLQGGEPGKVSGLLELSGCAATAPANCKIKEALTLETTAELVEDTKASKALLLFSPKKEGGTFAEVQFEGSGCALVSKPAKLLGDFATEVSPESSEEATSATLTLPTTGISLILGAENKIKEIGLKLGGTKEEGATLSGKTTVELESKEEFSAFKLAFRMTPPPEYMAQTQKQKVKIEALIVATITEIVMLVGPATFKIEPNACVKAYAATQVCEVEVEFNPAAMGNYIGIFGIHVMGDPADVYEVARLTGKW